MDVGGAATGVDNVPAFLVADHAGAAGTEARRRTALERQGFSAEEIEEMLEDPDADEDWAIVGMELDE
jgi:hypothetical protein